ncbi:MAG: hypothetical protein M3O02_06110 [Acidobacteriota bacterium]|nr:hypothetical protein [Acidobacteriota bacterium]
MPWTQPPAHALSADVRPQAEEEAGHTPSLSCETPPGTDRSWLADVVVVSMTAMVTPPCSVGGRHRTGKDGKRNNGKQNTVDRHGKLL